MGINRMHDDLIKLQELSERQGELLGRILETARNGLKILEGEGGLRTRVRRSARPEQKEW